MTEPTSPMINSVLGPLHPDDLGSVMMHEHIGPRRDPGLSPYYKEPSDPFRKRMAHEPVTVENLWWVRYNLRDNIDNNTPAPDEDWQRDMDMFAASGGGTLVEVTPGGFRGLARVAAMARETGSTSSPPPAGTSTAATTPTWTCRPEPSTSSPRSWCPRSRTATRDRHPRRHHRRTGLLLAADHQRAQGAAGRRRRPAADRTAHHHPPRTQRGGPRRDPRCPAGRRAPTSAGSSWPHRPVRLRTGHPAQPPRRRHDHRVRRPSAPRATTRPKPPSPTARCPRCPTTPAASSRSRTCSPAVRRPSRRRPRRAHEGPPDPLRRLGLRALPAQRRAPHADLGRRGERHRRPHHGQPATVADPGRCEPIIPDDEVGPTHLSTPRHPARCSGPATAWPRRPPAWPPHQVAVHQGAHLQRLRRLVALVGRGPGVVSGRPSPTTWGLGFGRRPHGARRRRDAWNHLVPGRHPQLRRALPGQPGRPGFRRPRPGGHRRVRHPAARGPDYRRAAGPGGPGRSGLRQLGVGLGTESSATSPTSPRP